MNDITTKIRYSLVIKLNAQMVWRLFTGLLWVNIFLIFIGSFVILWKAEEGVKPLICSIEILDNKLESINNNLPSYEVTVVESTLKGIVFPKNIQRFLPLELADTKRNIILNRTTQKIQYLISFSKNGRTYEVAYILNSDIKVFIFLFVGLLLCELLIIIKNIRQGPKMIRKTLKPLSDLAETANDLNAKLLSRSSTTDGTHIKDLTGMISSIDANQLDKRISIENSHDELKDLSFAINGMLNRINESYKSQVRFVSDASHELRTPISVIQGYINLLDRWGKKDEKTMQESIYAIKSETENMKMLVEQLLFLARSDNEAIQLQNTSFDVRDVISEIIQETQMIDPNHCFEVDLNKPAYIYADRQLIKQAIRILVDNSIKYTPEGKKIILRVVLEDDFVKIIVQDNGIGIQPEYLPQVFQRFSRSDESRARKTGGSGLGLSIAKWIVDHHEGYFEILSRVDIGTRVIMVIPACENN